jgi:3-hydroxyacyl-CoA dehydrogenase/enoyl-CoA hydratase/3-hydroxybutyryl-CoA epimerase/enoyl-CoA isomerase
MMMLKGDVLENFKSYSHKGIYHIVFDHMKRPYNFIDTQTLEELGTLIGVVEKGNYKGVVFSSNKSTFIVGANIKIFVTAHDAPDETINGFLKDGQDLFNRIEDLPIPTCSIIRGTTMGGGLELALACTTRLLVKDPVPENPEYTTMQLTKLALPEVKLGILPSWGGTTRLPRMIHPAKAIELICTGRNVKQKEALKIGLVDGIVEYSEALDTACELIYNLSDKDMLRWATIKNKKVGPTSMSKLRASVTYPIIKHTIGKRQKKMFGDPNKYPSPYKALETLKKSRTLYRDESLELERKAFIQLVRSDECRELVQKFLNGERE